MRNSVLFFTFILIFLNISTAGCANKMLSSAPSSFTTSAELSDNTAPPKNMLSASMPQLEPSAIDKQSQIKAKTLRLIIYNAGLMVVVDNISESLSAIKLLAESVDGYMQSMDTDSILIRVPAISFHSTLRQIEAMGDVTHKKVESQDVTEKMRDFQIRLSNAEKLRQRLIQLLDKAEKIKDAIEIEKELARVTETIETIKGKIRYLNDNIAFSTIAVDLNSPLPQEKVKEIIPFAWVRNLGNEISGKNSIDFYDSKSRSYIKFKLPRSFAQFYCTKVAIKATAADGTIVKIQRHENVEGGNLEFWADIIKRSLLINRTIKAGVRQEIRIGKKSKGFLFEGSKDIGSRKMHYLVCVAMSSKYVYSYEAWGEVGKIDNKIDDIKTSIQTLKVR